MNQFATKACRGLAFAFLTALCYGQATTSQQSVAAVISAKNITLEFDRSMASRVISQFGDTRTPLDEMQASEVLLLHGRELGRFGLKNQSTVDVPGMLGPAHRLVLTGTSGAIQKTETIDSYTSYPDMLFINVEYRNIGSSDLHVAGWVNGRHSLLAAPKPSTPPFWSLLNGSYESRPDWVRPLNAPFHQKNYLGMNAADYGGGTPVIDIWRRDVGLALGHDELAPKLVSFPVDMENNGSATISMRYLHPQILKAGESLKTFETFLAVHQGDYFRTLVNYRRVMVARGVRFQSAPSDGFDPIWCAWGYGRSVQLKQVYDTLPTAKKLGFSWVTLDDGWQNNYGDWAVDPKKFPNGDADMKALVDRIHQEGFRAQLWWSPLSAVPASQLLKDHPDWALLNKDGSRRKISWWNSDYLCPADHDVVEYHKALVRKILGEWGFDGLKLDGQRRSSKLGRFSL